MAPKKTTTAKKTAGEAVYEYLREGIVELRLRPGQILSIQEISEHLKVSRSPIRDALIRLEKDGLISSAPKKGTLISKIDVDRAMNEHFARLCLEERVISLFTEIVTDQDLAYLSEQIKEQKKHCADSDSRLFLKLDDTFHGYFYKQTGKSFCFDLMQSNTGHYSRIRLLSSMDQDMLNQSMAHHEELLRLIGKKEKKAVENCMHDHLMKVSLEIPQLERKFPELFESSSEALRLKSDIWHYDYFDTIAGNEGR